MFNESAKDTVDEVVNGFNGTFFAYGQTGSGKSFSMFGPDSGNDDVRGIIPRSSQRIFQKILSDQSDTNYVVKCSFLEIYNEQIRDLLNPSQTNLQVRESPQRGIYVGDATETVCIVSTTYISADLRVLFLLSPIVCHKRNRNSKSS